MRILGIDPGLNITGYGIIEIKEPKIRLIECGFIKTQANKSFSERLSKIYKAVTEVIEEFKPDKLILEKLYSHYRHPTTAILMGHVRGVICLSCARMGVTLVSYSATRIKKAITGKGNVSKQQVKMMVGRLLTLNRLPEYADVTDALALAIAHVYIDKVRK